MEKCIYGVRLDEKITPEKVREAIIECFARAHSEVLEEEHRPFNSVSKKRLEALARKETRFIVKSAFEYNGVDFKRPKKKDLIRIINTLAEMASKYRNKETIKKHYNEIMTLIEKLE